ncbi:von Willebrand factor type D protein [[Leptolyngbya] sp. PCC 7376]|uniref:VWD domain-containing protein n=1 Tax=[Leptolyngbya] sp. PCC 7376 TaxID=111781 RepID=UPI00029F2902|nr:VWD domain-containing protein [[Leptolyngbya] sp. PCC 7376]AFY37392.1 von Willebrand factor type D protein [[Leptolyngbya] sp. PCC 7376]
MSLLSYLQQRWRFLRWALLFFLSACLILFSAAPSPGQTLVNEGDFCEINTDSMDDVQQGRSYGDPHINTFDGFHYSFQTLGEYILTKSDDGSFEVQTRQERVPERDNLSLNTAVAMNVCGDRLAIYVDGDDAKVWLNGSPLAMNGSAVALDNNGEVQRQGSGDYGIIWPSGDQVRVKSITVAGSRFLNIMPLIRTEHRRDVIGLLGNFNRDPDDDLMSRDGTVIPAKSTYSVATNMLDRALPSVIPVRQLESAYFENLYRQFGDSWRVRQGESLFDYLPGQSMATFTNFDFPSSFFTLNQASPVQVRDALDTCQAAGVEDELLDGCVFDVAATGQTSFAQAALNAVTDTLARELQNRLVDEVQKVIPSFPFF